MEYRNDPAVFLYGDGDDAFARARRTVELAGLRLVGMAAIDDAAPGVPGATPIVEAERETPALIALLDRLQDEAGPSSGAEAGERGASPAEIRAMIRARRLRDQYFSGALFADPAWDMLLDLMAARLEQKRVAVSSLCIAAAVPPTTALRWIKALTDRGLFVRSADPRDGRRVYIELSDETARALADYLAAAKRIAPAAI